MGLESDIQDWGRRSNAPRHNSYPAPNVLIDDFSVGQPTVCLQINGEWVRWLTGVLDVLLDPIYWTDNLENALYSIAELQAALHGASATMNICGNGVVEVQLKVGSYAGSGTLNRQITGVGFQPEFVLVYMQNTSDTARGFGWRATGDSGAFLADFDGEKNYEGNHLRSLDADGFTVSADTGGSASVRLNKSARNYTYIAIGQ